ncbi:MAG TPA: hypothetical protein VJH34_00850 [archaeon]|nr:hypothetical protein [archaeon]
MRAEENEISLIMDFDGTLVSMRNKSLEYRKTIIEELSLWTGLNYEAVEKDFNYGRELVLKNPTEYGWNVNGYKSFFGDEDPFVLYTSAADAMNRNLPAYKIMKNDDFMERIDRIFHTVTNHERPPISKKTKKALEKLLDMYDVTIVSGSSNESIKKCLDDAGLEIETIGNAKKVFVDTNFDKVNRHLNIINKYKIELRRPYYYDILSKIDGRKVVVGDIFSIDLALPKELGIPIILKKNYYTPMWSRMYVGIVGEVVNDMEQLSKLDLRKLFL